MWRLVPGMAVAVAAIVAGCIWWSAGGKDHFVPRRWAVVDPGLLYRSGQLDSHLVKAVWKSHGIRVVVNLGVDKSNPTTAAEIEAAADLGITRYSFWLNGDGTGDPASYVNAIAVMVDAHRHGLPVNLHCSAGTDRTGGVTAVYRMLVEGWSPAEAWDELVERGWKDKGPHATLPVFINDHLHQIRADLIAKGVIPADAPNPTRFGPNPNPAAN